MGSFKGYIGAKLGKPYTSQKCFGIEVGGQAQLRICICPQHVKVSQIRLRLVTLEDMGDVGGPHLGF